MNLPLLSFQAVRYAWRGLDGSLPSKPLLNDFHLTLAAREKVVLLGANGCGKSTVLKLANGLIFPQQGSIRWRGEELTAARLRQTAFARKFRRGNTLLFQNPASMLFNATVLEEIAYAPKVLGWPDALARSEHWAAALGLGGVLDSQPQTLSGGQQQKLALACVLVLEPDCLLLDEPSASLDPATVGWLIDTLVQADKTMLISTHNLSLAAEIAQRAVVMSPQAEILADGDIDVVLRDMELLVAANLAHRHQHHHGAVSHNHPHSHDW